MDNFRIAKAMTTIKKECASLDGQCDMGCCLFDYENGFCKLFSSKMGEPRDWKIEVEVSPLKTRIISDEDGVL